MGSWLVFLEVSLFEPEPEPEPINLDAEDSDEQLMNDFINKLQSYKLFTLQSRILTKLLSIIFFIGSTRRETIIL